MRRSVPQPIRSWHALGEWSSAARATAGERPAEGRAATRAIRSHYRKFKTITFDNGTEFHDYKLLEERFTLKCYFATPYHSWERGSNENTNGLIRQYLPKGECMSEVTQAHCDFIANELNTRPRKRHGYSTPADLYQRH